MQIGKLRFSKKKILLIAGTLLLIVAAGYFACFDSARLQERDTSLRIFDRRGQPLGFLLADQERYSAPCDLTRVSSHFLRAIVLVEDRSFHSHWGVNLSSLGRALFQNVRQGRVVSGGSTITMQLAKMLLNPNRKRTIFRKISEILFALKLELHLPKSRILEEYVNRLPFGNLIYGIRPAAEFYFGKSPDQLSLGQAIELAVIPKAPTSYNPLTHQHRLKRRRDRILEELRRSGYLSGDEFSRVSSEEVHFRMQTPRLAAPHFIELIKRRANPAGGEERQIFTSLDRRLQLKVRGIIREHLSRLKHYHVQSAAAVVIDNQAREVVAYLGSPDYFDTAISGYIDYAIALRQPGSTLKPFVYGLALEEGYTPASLLPDIRFPARGGFFPQNHDGREHGPLRLRIALACSYNIPAFYLAMKLTPSRILETLQMAGFTYLDQPSGFYGETIALGSGEVRLLDLVTAYSCLANRGILYTPGVIREAPPGPRERIFSEETAFLLFDILSDPAARAGSFGYYSSMNLPFPLAMKTGTSKGFRDKWAVGVNSEYTVGVWMGNPDGRNILQQVAETGNTPTMVRDIFLMLQTRWDRGGIPVPEGVVQREVCALSGELPTAWCRDRVEEYFVKGQVPRTSCSFHRMQAGEVKTVYPELYRDWRHQNRVAEQTGLERSRAVRIVSPQPGDRYYISAAIPRESQQIRFKVMGAAKGERITYFLNGKLYRTLAYPRFPAFVLTRGEYTLQVLLDGEPKDRVTFRVY